MPVRSPCVHAYPNWDLGPMCSSRPRAPRKAGEWQQALHFLEYMDTVAVEPSIISYNAAISACEKVRVGVCGCVFVCLCLCVFGSFCSRQGTCKPLCPGKLRSVTEQHRLLGCFGALGDF